MGKHPGKPREATFTPFENLGIQMDEKLTEEEKAKRIEEREEETIVKEEVKDMERELKKAA